MEVTKEMKGTHPDCNRPPVRKVNLQPLEIVSLQNHDLLISWDLTDSSPLGFGSK